MHTIRYSSTLAPDDHDPRGPREPTVGDVLGAYRLEELAGEGGMGRVFRAVHVKLGRTVALKLLRRRYSTRPDAVARFFHEARAVNVIRHPNIVEITDFVEGTLDSYYIMEWLEGTELTGMLEANGAMPWRDVLRYGRQIASAMHAVHEAGFVHRDLKPENVFVVNDRDGTSTVKILDFGVALLAGEEDGAVAGTPVYFSPECAAGRPVDARSDIYSFGVMLYELLAGCPPFLADTFSQYVMKHMTAPAPPLVDAVPAPIPPALAAAVARCLEKDPAKRFQSMEELERALAALEPQPPAPRAPRSWLVGATAVGLVAAALLGSARLVSPRTVASASPSLPPAVLAAPPATGAAAERGSFGTPAAAGAEARVAVTMASTPPGAEVVRDGAVLGVTPCTLRLPPGPVAIEVRAPGYRALARTIDVEPDATFAVELERLPVRRARPSRASSSATPAASSGTPAPAPVSDDATVDPFAGQ